ncbi:MAG: hypothetical protein V4597_08560 [Pseudomonadota bacterium]
MFSKLSLRGTGGAILWGHREAVLLGPWTITQDKKSKAWTLKASAARVDAFQARQRPLWFSAPRPKGFWMWGIDKLEVAGLAIVAHLGPPER